MAVATSCQEDELAEAYQSNGGNPKTFEMMKNNSSVCNASMLIDTINKSLD